MKQENPTARLESTAFRRGGGSQMRASLPPEVVGQVDQEKKACDDLVDRMAVELRLDLDSGLDPSYLWYSLAQSSVEAASPARLSAALSSALLKLAKQPMTILVGDCPQCGYKIVGTTVDIAVSMMSLHMRKWHVGGPKATVKLQKK